MKKLNLDELLTQSLVIEDNGFTESVMEQLPETELTMPVLKPPQVYIWTAAFVVVFCIVVIASLNSDYSAWLSAGMVSIFSVSLFIALPYLDELFT